MKIIKNIVLILISISAIHAHQDLTHFNYKSASVLPFYTIRKEKYLILSREAYGRPKIGKKWTYDDFGGKRDTTDATALFSAAREFFEEGILGRALNINLEELCTYIENNTHWIIAHTTKRNAKNVTYIVNFKKYKDAFLDNFYKARKESTAYENLEKDRIALVKWSDLEKAFRSQLNNNPVYVKAKVINPANNKTRRQRIKLRPYFTIKLKSFFLNEPYSSGKNKKIRFYA